MRGPRRCGRHRLFRQVYLHGLLLLLVSGVALAVLAVWPGPGLPEHLRERVPARLIAAELGPRVGDRPALEAELVRLQRILGADLAVYGTDGALLGSAGRRPPPPLRPVQSRNIGEWRFVRAGGVSALAIALPGGAYGLVTRHKAWHSRFIVFVAVALALGALISLPVARAITRPLERLTETSRRLAAGDFSARSGIVRDDEVGALAAAMDDMAAGLEARIRRERELLGNVSHELRTPLARLRVALEIAEESGDPDAVRRHLAGISSDVAELERLVADVLAVSRIGAAGEDLRITPAPARFEEIAGGAAARFRRGHPGRELRLKIAESLPGLSVDATLVGRALDNLLENAARYADQSQPVMLRARVEGGAFVVEVADRGIGVAAEDLPRLFEPFFRSERSRTRDAGGTGLGLTLCKRIAEAHGGSIAAAPNPGGGLVVTMRLLLQTSPGKAAHGGRWAILMALLLLPHAALAQGHAMTEEYSERLVAAAVAQTRSSVTYDGAYRRIGYPWGDVPETIGVCADVVVRAYRRLGVDLQVEAHQDMQRAFGSYPQLWGMSGPDPNIDHRRVPNLRPPCST